MIHGSLQQFQVLGHLAQTPAFQRALAWLRKLPPDPTDGTTEFDSRDLLVNVMRYDTKPRDACNWESHRQTADLQYIFAGGELIDWTPEIPTAPSISYEAGKDFEFWPATIATACTLHLKPGTFVVFLPGEIHRPAIQDGVVPHVRKAVFKINARLLPPVLT